MAEKRVEFTPGIRLALEGSALGTSARVCGCDGVEN